MINIRKKKLVTSIALSVGLLAAGGSVQAVMDVYSETVGAFNGSAYTDTLLKDGAFSSYFTTDNVEGSYTVDARVRYYSFDSGIMRNGQWFQSMTDGDDVEFLTHIDGTEEMQISNDLSTPVQVDVSGLFETAWD